MAKKKYGPMDIDYRVRCVKPNGDFDRIYYGNTAADYAAMDGAELAKTVYDITDNFKDLGRGRQTGNPIELEYARSKHFFNKRVFFDGETIQGRGDASGVGAPNGKGSASGAGEAQAGEGSAGCGDRVASDDVFHAPENIQTEGGKDGTSGQD